MSKVCVDIIIPVRNNMNHIRNCLQNVIAQQSNSLFQMGEVIVVDDASTDKTVDVIKNEFPDRVQLIELYKNKGRAEARNIGARHGKGSIIIFLDSDCNFISYDGVSAHVDKILNGFDVSFGKIIVQNHAFWDGYMQKIMASRERKSRAGDFMVFTSANFAIRREVFLRHGGFDSRYRHYGFEDRDLIARLIKGGATFSYTPKSIVIHDADFSLTTITGKIKESGIYTSALFSTDHPKMYARTSYSKFDVRLRPWLGIFTCILKPLFPGLLKLSSWIIDSHITPFSIKFFMVKTISAIAFFLGTTVNN